MYLSIVSGEQTSKKDVDKLRDIQQRAKEWVNAWKTAIGEVLFLAFASEKVKLDPSSGTKGCTSVLFR